MKKALLLLLVCALAAPSMALAQVRADDLFHWFPQGSYLTLTHRNFESLKKASVYDLFQRLYAPQEELKDIEKGEERQVKSIYIMPGELKIGRELSRAELELPAALRNSVYWATAGTVLELADLPNSEKEEPMKLLEMSKERTMISIDMDVNGSNKDIAVYRIDDPTAVEQALKAGELVDTGKKFLGRSLYTFGLGGGDKREDAILLWIAADGDILVARDRKLLARMVFAGRGRISGIIDDPLYADLQSVVPELGQIWQIKYSQLLQRAMTRAMDDGTVEDENAESIVIGNSPMYRVRSLNVDSEIVSVEILVYESSEKAEAAFKGEDTNVEKLSTGTVTVVMGSSNSTLDPKKKRELRDNLIISKLTLDKDSLAEEQKARDAAIKTKIEKSKK